MLLLYYTLIKISSLIILNKISQYFVSLKIITHKLKEKTFFMSLKMW